MPFACWHTWKRAAHMVIYPAFDTLLCILLFVKFAANLQHKMFMEKYTITFLYGLLLTHATALHCFNLVDSRIEREARRNTPPELTRCTTFEAMTNVLRVEEYNRLRAIKEEFKVPDHLWQECMTEIRTNMKQHAETTYKSTKADKDHSLREIDPESYSRIIQALETYGINPDSVDILFDKESVHKASARSYFYRYNNNFEWASYLSNQRARIHYTPFYDMKIQSTDTYYQKFYQYITPMHEAMHVSEQHTLQRYIIREHLKKLGHTVTHIEKNQSYKNLCRTQEKIAELMPLLQSKDLDIIRILFDACVEDCSQQTKKIEWNRSPPDATHPCWCSEEFPWVIKMRDLIREERIKKEMLATLEKLETLGMP
jgi:hypothetical protein